MSMSCHIRFLIPAPVENDGSDESNGSGEMISRLALCSDLVCVMANQMSGLPIDEFFVKNSGNGVAVARGNANNHIHPIITSLPEISMRVLDKSITKFVIAQTNMDWFTDVQNVLKFDSSIGHSHFKNRSVYGRVPGIELSRLAVIAQQYNTGDLCNASAKTDNGNEILWPMTNSIHCYPESSSTSQDILNLKPVTTFGGASEKQPDDTHPQFASMDHRMIKERLSEIEERTEDCAGEVMKFGALSDEFQGLGADEGLMPLLCCLCHESSMSSYGCSTLLGGAPITTCPNCLSKMPSSNGPVARARKAPTGSRARDTQVVDPEEWKKVDVAPLLATTGHRAWFSDEIVVAFIRMELEANPSLVLLEPAVFAGPRHEAAQRIKELLRGGARIVFLPVCLRFHWSILVITWEAVELYDSVVQKVPEEIKSLSSLLGIQMRVPRGQPRQDDLINCGVYCCLRVKAIASGTTLTNADVKREIPKFRLQFLRRLQISNFPIYVGQHDAATSGKLIEDALAEVDETERESSGESEDASLREDGPGESDETVQPHSDNDVDFENTVSEALVLEDEPFEDSKDTTGPAEIDGEIDDEIRLGFAQLMDEPSAKKRKVYDEFVLMDHYGKGQFDIVADWLSAKGFVSVRKDDIVIISSKPCTVRHEGSCRHTTFATHSQKLSIQLQAVVNLQEQYELEQLLVPFQTIQAFIIVQFLFVLKLKLQKDKQFWVFGDTIFVNGEHRCDLVAKLVIENAEEAREALKEMNRRGRGVVKAKLAQFIEQQFWDQN